MEIVLWVVGIWFGLSLVTCVAWFLWLCSTRGSQFERDLAEAEARADRLLHGRKS